MRDISLFCAIMDIVGDVFMRKTAFIGHRQVFGKGAHERIMCEAEKQINLGCKSFTMGTHGEFDKLALSACRSMQKGIPILKLR